MINIKIGGNIQITPYSTPSEVYAKRHLDCYYPNFGQVIRAVSATPFSGDPGVFFKSVISF